MGHAGGWEVSVRILIGDVREQLATLPDFLVTRLNRCGIVCGREGGRLIPVSMPQSSNPDIRGWPPELKGWFETGCICLEAVHALHGLGPFRVA